MRRRRTIRTGCAVLAVATLTAPLAGCADLIGGTPGEPGAPTGPAQPTASTGPADPAVVVERARYYGVVPEYVLTIDVEGLEAISHAGGAYGADGYSAVLADASTGDAVMLSAVTGDLSAATCPDLPVLTTSGSVADGQVECAADGEMFRRTAGDSQEYAVQRDGAVVRVSGTGVEPALLRGALESVRVPTADELDHLLPPSPLPPSPSAADESGGTDDGGLGTGADEPVERGDLPPGDGAPDNSVGVGG